MASLTSADFKQVFLYPIKSKDWFVNLCLQGALIFMLSFTLIGLPLLTGFMVAFVRRGIANDTSLPGWDEWGRYWYDGWRVFIVNIVYGLPIILYWGLVGIAFVTSLALTAYDEDFALLLPFVFILFLFGYFGTIIYSIAISLIGPAVQPLIALNLPLKKAWQWRQIVWPYLKHNIVNIILVLIYGYLAGMVASLGMFAFFIGIFFTYPYAIAVLGYTTGRVYALSEIKYV